MNIENLNVGRSGEINVNLGYKEPNYQEPQASLSTTDNLAVPDNHNILDTSDNLDALGSLDTPDIPQSSLIPDTPEGQGHETHTLEALKALQSWRNLTQRLGRPNDKFLQNFYNRTVAAAHMPNVLRKMLKLLPACKQGKEVQACLPDNPDWAALIGNISKQMDIDITPTKPSLRDPGSDIDNGSVDNSSTIGTQTDRQDSNQSHVWLDTGFDTTQGAEYNRTEGIGSEGHAEKSNSKNTESKTRHISPDNNNKKASALFNDRMDMGYQGFVKNINKLWATKDNETLSQSDFQKKNPTPRPKLGEITDIYLFEDNITKLWTEEESVTLQTLHDLSGQEKGSATRPYLGRVTSAVGSVMGSGSGQGSGLGFGSGSESVSGSGWGSGSGFGLASGLGSGSGSGSASEPEFEPELRACCSALEVVEVLGRLTRLLGRGTVTFLQAENLAPARHKWRFVVGDVDMTLSIKEMAKVLEMENLGEGDGMEGLLTLECQVFGKCSKSMV